MSSMHSARQGIIQAGGSGSRLYPMTAAISKQADDLLSADDADAGGNTRDPDYLDRTGLTAVPAIAGRWRRVGLALHYAAQPASEGIAQACLIGRAFLAGGPAALILGDNIFYGHGLEQTLAAASARIEGATVFACRRSAALGRDRIRPQGQDP